MADYRKNINEISARMGEEGRGETWKSGFQDRCLKPLGHPSLKPVLCQIVQRPSSVTRAARSLLSRWTLFLQIVLRLPGAPDGFALNPLADEMDPASAWSRHHDGHLEPTIRLDPVHQAVSGRHRRCLAHRADHVLGAHRPADGVLARPRV